MLNASNWIFFLFINDGNGSVSSRRLSLRLILFLISDEVPSSYSLSSNLSEISEISTWNAFFKWWLFWTYKSSASLLMLLPYFNFQIDRLGSDQFGLVSGAYLTLFVCCWVSVLCEMSPAQTCSYLVDWSSIPWILLMYIGIDFFFSIDVIISFWNVLLLSFRTFSSLSRVMCWTIWPGDCLLLYLSFIPELIVDDNSFDSVLQNKLFGCDGGKTSVNLSWAALMMGFLNLSSGIFKIGNWVLWSDVFVWFSLWE